jgi:hypothetical protein
MSRYQRWILYAALGLAGFWSLVIFTVWSLL